MSSTARRASLFTRIRAIYRDAWSMYRTHFGFIVGTAAIVLVPLAIFDGLGILRFHASGADPIGTAMIVVLAIASTGFSGLAAIFFAGLLDHTADAWRAGRPSPSPASVARHLPWLQLFLASVFAFVIEIVALGLFVVPGLVLYSLFILTGPMLVREDLKAVPALMRSAGLVRHHPVLVTVAVVIPALLEGTVADFAGLVFGHHVAIELVAEILVTLFVASFIGVVEVVTAYHLQRDHPRKPTTTSIG